MDISDTLMLELNSCYKTTPESHVTRDDVLLWYWSLRKSNPLQGGDRMRARNSAGSFNYKDRSGESDITRSCPPQRQAMLREVLWTDRLFKDTSRVDTD